MEYDLAKAKETRTQLLMGGCICIGVHYKWGYMQAYTHTMHATHTHMHIPYMHACTRRSLARRSYVSCAPHAPRTPRAAHPRATQPATADTCACICSRC